MPNAVSIGRVLLVDDDPDVRMVGELALAEVAGWEVVVASSGAEALELAESSSPDLIILDVMMPDMDGPETLARLRAGPLAHIPVVFMTARAQAHEIDDYVRAGAVGVVRKPFDPMTVADQIRAILADV